MLHLCHIMGVGRQSEDEYKIICIPEGFLEIKIKNGTLP